MTGIRFEGIKTDDKHALVKEIVCLIPAGSVASYGMIASLCAGVTPRLVGFVLAGLKLPSAVPWQRVINASGCISARPGSDLQREALSREGIIFTAAGKVSWALYAWHGPSLIWFETKGVTGEDGLALMHGWRHRK